MVESSSVTIWNYLKDPICLAGGFHWIRRVALVDSTFLLVESTGRIRGLAESFLYKGGISQRMAATPNGFDGESARLGRSAAESISLG